MQTTTKGKARIKIHPVAFGTSSAALIMSLAPSESLAITLLGPGTLCQGAILIFRALSDLTDAG
jgi:hypothetical protein